MHWFKSLSETYSKLHRCIRRSQQFGVTLQRFAEEHQFPHRYRTYLPNVNCEDIGLRLRRKQPSRQPIMRIKPLEDENASKSMPIDKDKMSVTLNSSELVVIQSKNHLRNLMPPTAKNVTEMHHSQAWKLKSDIFFNRQATKDYYPKTNLLQKPIINIKRPNHQFRNEVFVQRTTIARFQSCADKSSVKKPEPFECKTDCSKKDENDDDSKIKALICQAICKGKPVWEGLSSSSTCGASKPPPPPPQQKCGASTAKTETKTCGASKPPSAPATPCGTSKPPPAQKSLPPLPPNPKPACIGAANKQADAKDSSSIKTCDTDKPSVPPKQTFAPLPPQPPPVCLASVQKNDTNKSSSTCGASKSDSDAFKACAKKGPTQSKCGASTESDTNKSSSTCGASKSDSDAFKACAKKAPTKPKCGASAESDTNKSSSTCGASKPPQKAATSKCGDNKPLCEPPKPKCGEKIKTCDADKPPAPKCGDNKPLCEPPKPKCGEQIKTCDADKPPAAKCGDNKPLCEPPKPKCGEKIKTCDADKQPASPPCDPPKPKSCDGAKSPVPPPSSKPAPCASAVPLEPNCGDADKSKDKKPLSCESFAKTDQMKNAKSESNTTKTCGAEKPAKPKTCDGGKSPSPSAPAPCASAPPLEPNCGDADKSKADKPLSCGSSAKTDKPKSAKSTPKYPASHPKCCGAPQPRPKSGKKKTMHAKCQKPVKVKGPESDLPLIPKLPTNFNKDPNKTGNDNCGNEHGYDIDGVPNTGVPDGPPTQSTSSAASTSSSTLICCEQSENRGQTEDGVHIQPADVQQDCLIVNTESQNTAVAHVSVGQPDNLDSLTIQNMSFVELTPQISEQGAALSQKQESIKSPSISGNTSNESRSPPEAVPLPKRICDVISSPTDAVKLNWPKPGNIADPKGTDEPK